MRFLIFALIGLICSVSCRNEPRSEEPVEVSTPVEVYAFDDLELLLKVDEDQIRVVNFWATWCKPCLEELPVFEAIQDSLGEEGLEVILVSLDFPKKLETQLIPYVKENKLRSRVILLDDPRENFWIPKVDSAWSGALPATLIISNTKRVFYERSFDRESLDKELAKFLKTAS